MMPFSLLCTPFRPLTTPPTRAGVYALFLDSLGPQLKKKMLNFNGTITLFKINTQKKKGHKVEKVQRRGGLGERAKEQLRLPKPAPKIGNGEEILPEEDLDIGAMTSEELERFLRNETNLKKLSRFDYYMTGQVNSVVLFSMEEDLGTVWSFALVRPKPTKLDGGQRTTTR
jgi:hypothetical protein